MTQNDFIKDHIIICGVQKYDFIIDADRTNKLHTKIIDADEQQKECNPIIIVE